MCFYDDATEYLTVWNNLFSAQLLGYPEETGRIYKLEKTDLVS